MATSEPETVHGYTENREAVLKRAASLGVDVDENGKSLSAGTAKRVAKPPETLKAAAAIVPTAAQRYLDTAQQVQVEMVDALARIRTRIRHDSVAFGVEAELARHLGRECEQPAGQLRTAIYRAGGTLYPGTLPRLLRRHGLRQQIEAALYRRQ